MLKYIFKRILIFIPTLFAISLITFILSLNAPGDPVENMLSGGKGGEGQLSDKLASEATYLRVRHEMGLDLPLFYFSVSNAAVSDTLYKYPKAEHRDNLERLAYMYGNWSNIVTYYHKIKLFEYELLKVKKDTSNAQSLIKIRDLVNQLYSSYNETRTSVIFEQLDEIFNYSLEPVREDRSLLEEKKQMDQLFESSIRLHDLRYILNGLETAYQNMLRYKKPWQKYIPSLKFYGSTNQYHRWLFGDEPWFTSSNDEDNYTSAGFLRGDFGISYIDKRPVKSVIWDALKWTLILSSIAILITYIVSIPLGVNSAVTKGTTKDKIITTLMFVLYSLPGFWIATMLVMFLGGGDYLDWFPPYGTGNLTEDDPLLDRFFDTAYHMVLPIFCLTYPTFAFLSRQARGGMLNVLNQDFIRTAKAKGLSSRTIVWKHALKNALLPIITLFANVFPHAIAGSIVLEIIFNIPGMGKVTYDAIFARNYPIVFTVMMFTSILTLVGYLVSDILYALVDPRISYGGKKK